MSVANRIEQAPACEVIRISEAEQAAYGGAGWHLARFVAGRLEELFDPTADVPWSEDTQAMADQAGQSAIAWLKAAWAAPDTETWLVMCSCMELCEPRRIDPHDASGLARMMRVIGEALAESAD